MKGIILTTFAVAMAFSAPAFAMSKKTMKDGNTHYWVNGSEPEDDTYEALTNYILDDGETLKNGDVIHYYEQCSLADAKSNKCENMADFFYVLGTVNKNGDKDFTYQTSGDNALDYSSFTQDDITDPADLSFYHNSGYTGSGWSIHNPYTGTVNVDNDLHIDLQDAALIAPAAEYGTFMTDSQAHKKNWSVKVQKNGEIDSFISFSIKGSNKLASRKWETMQAAKAAIVWHKFAGATTAEMLNLLNDSTDVMDAANFDPSGQISDGDTLRNINLNTAFYKAADDYLN